MKFKDLFIALENSEVYKKFKKENPNSFLCAGFFVLDFKSAINESSLDFANQNKIASFSYRNNNFDFKEEEIMDKTKSLEKLEKRINIEIESLGGLVQKEFLKNKINSNLDKIIAVLQSKDNFPFWNLTCICSNLSIYFVHINALTGETARFEKKDLFDFVKIKKQ